MEWVYSVTIFTGLPRESQTYIYGSVTCLEKVPDTKTSRHRTQGPCLEMGWLHPNCLLGIVLASANFQTMPGSYSVECQAAWAKTMPDTSLAI